MSKQDAGPSFILTRCGTGGAAGPGGTSPWKMSRGGGVKQFFPPLDHAVVKALACELVSQTHHPLSRQSLADLTGRAHQALGKPISWSTIGRLLEADAMKPWQYKYWIFPRAPLCAAKAGRVLDVYAEVWEGEPLGPQDHIISADEKTSIQARIRCHPSLPPAPGRAHRIEYEYERGGALQYLAGWMSAVGTSWDAAHHTPGSSHLGGSSPKSCARSHTARASGSSGWWTTGRPIVGKPHAGGSRWPIQT
jgi:hypothetical protein